MRRHLISLMAASTVLVSPASASAAFIHTVLPGESLSSIAAADGLSVDQLAAANGLSPTAQLTVGSTITIPPQGGETATPSLVSVPSSAAADGDADTDDPGTATPAVSPTADGDADNDDQGTASSTTPAAASTSAAAPATAGSYVVQPGDTLSAIAARAGTSVDALAAANGLDPNGVLQAGTALVLSGTGASVPPPATAPTVGTTVVGRMTWFGGPNDPSAQGTPASGLGWLSNGMAYYNTGSLGNRWLIHFPWGQTVPMTQIDVGPAPWTGNPFDIAYSALPSTPYNQSNWPNPVVTGTYEGP